MPLTALYVNLYASKVWGALYQNTLYLSIIMLLEQVMRVEERGSMNTPPLDKAV